MKNDGSSSAKFGMWVGVMNYVEITIKMWMDSTGFEPVAFTLQT